MSQVSRNLSSIDFSSCFKSNLLKHFCLVYYRFDSVSRSSVLEKIITFLNQFLKCLGGYGIGALKNPKGKEK